ncbi:DNA-processing protein DprA [Alkalicoccobacillus plakortidis]|uniref:DNA-processing protein DprA n=1 Tax=Alkalicoccobacillus plakortidis TaxID=444060 RepID=A0ABT0XFR9_9BACI|nr:DNA-processing protein DprA [Alkalicoccobacillus plakortidis]MCM2674750.1 DNA-processing protein DprA [Alkalicoccobacillus plakortidis]
MTWSKLSQLLTKDPELTLIYSMNLTQLSSFFYPTLKKPQDFYYDLHSISPIETTSSYLQKSIHVLTYFDVDYPALLKQTYDPPWVLYIRGDASLLQETKTLAVVGTRLPTQLGKRSIETLLPPIIKQGYVIVSGLAKGIDRLSHIEAIKHNGKTMAVIGSGFDYMYPKENKALYEHLVSKHVVLTEYPPFIPPQKWHFPARNRIISGLSKGILVVEAAEKSGSLISADQALEQGRDVFAVPGPIFSPVSQGTNHLIQQGAKLVRDANDITEEWS